MVILIKHASIFFFNVEVDEPGKLITSVSVL